MDQQPLELTFHTVFVPPCDNGETCIVTGQVTTPPNPKAIGHIYERNVEQFHHEMVDIDA